MSWKRIKIERGVDAYTGESILRKRKAKEVAFEGDDLGLSCEDEIKRMKYEGKESQTTNNTILSDEYFPRSYDFHQYRSAAAKRHADRAQ